MTKRMTVLLLGGVLVVGLIVWQAVGEDNGGQLKTLAGPVAIRSSIERVRGRLDEAPGRIHAIRNGEQSSKIRVSPVSAAPGQKLPPINAEAAARYRAFLSAAQLSSEQEEQLNKVLWDAQRNYRTGDEEDRQDFDETLEKLRLPGGKVDVAKLQAQMREQRQSVYEQANQTIDEETEAAVAKFLSSEQIELFHSKLWHPSLWAAHLNFSQE
jgi:hypothetical protein